MESKSNAITWKDVFIGCLLFVISASAVTFHRGKRLYGDRIRAKEKVSLYLRENTTIDDVSLQLSRKGVWIDRNEMRWASGVLGWKTAVRGHYRLEGSTSYANLLQKLAMGRQDPVKVIVLPGIDRQTLIESVSARMFFKADSLDALLKNPVFLSEFGLLPGEVLGRLWPATYEFYWTAAPSVVVSKLLKTFSEQTRELDFERGTPLNLSMNEVLTLASIVEWESKDFEERKMVAGLYLNRLKKGMRLQADPTVAFAIGSRRRLTFEDYKFQHPYNTYLIDGLPPGPINNPSIESIKAALNPVLHGYIYMVASPTGKHVFTSTWEQHKIESEKWRRWIRQQVKLRQQRESMTG